jgi:hypothetical protein
MPSEESNLSSLERKYTILQLFNAPYCRHSTRDITAIHKLAQTLPYSYSGIWHPGSQ